MKNFVINKRKSILDLRGVGIAVALLAFVGILITFISLENDRDVGFDNEEIRMYQGECVIRVGEEEKITTLPATVDARIDEVVTITTTLSADVGEEHFLAFYGRQADIKLYLNDELLLESDKGYGLPFPMTPGSYWHFVRLPHDYEGKELRIERVARVERFAQEVPGIYMGTKAAFLYMVVKQGMFALIVGIPIVFVGFVLVVMGLFLKNRETARRMVFLGLFAVTISVWNLLEARITQLFFSDIQLASFILFSCFFLMPVMIMAYLLTYPTLAKRIYMQVMFWVSLLAYMVANVLQVLGVAYYIDSITLIHVIIGLIAVCFLVSFYQLRKEPKEEIQRDKAVYTAFLILAVSAALDVVNYYVYPDAVVGTYCKIGIFLFICYLGFAAMKQNGEQHLLEERQRVYRELAYTDGMTGLSSRHAFEVEMARIRNGVIKKKPLVVVADMNFLKIINDNYGHAKGDEAISKVAELLEAHFAQIGKCFRIGGDEFCAILYPKETGIFEKAYDEFCKSVERQREEVDYPFAVAVGYASEESEDVDTLFKLADERMYTAKVSMKTTRK